MSAELLWRLAATIVLIGLNAFFVAAEFALTRLPSIELSEADLERSHGLRRAKSMVDRLELHLTGCQLGISSTSVILGVVAEPAFTVLLAPVVGLFGIEGTSARAVSVVVAVVFINLIHKIWGEQAPTYVGVERPREVAERLAPILYWWSRIMMPIIRLGDSAAKWTLRLFGVEVTRSWAAEAEGLEDEEGRPVGDRAELKRRIGKLLTRGQISRDRQREVLASLEIEEIPTKDVMVPAADMVPLSLEASSEENRLRIARSGHARYAVLKGDDGRRGDLRRSDVAGVVYVPALFDPPERLAGDLRLEELLEDVVYCSPELSVADLIDRLQSERQEIALVADDDRVLGLVTITDLLETIAGQVEDPLDSRTGSG